MIVLATKTRHTRRRTRSTVFQKHVFVSVFVFFVTSWPGTVQGHSGPPFPIVTDQQAGAYRVTVWTDPDATDDQTAAGRFWVTVAPGAPNVVVSIKPLDGKGMERAATAGAVNGDKQRHFTSLLMDHEGRYGVHVTIDGPQGTANVDAYTDATYDLRPRPILTVIFVLPFLLIGFVWGKLLIKRRMHARGGK